MSDVKVQDLGDVAVVTGKLVEKGRYKSNDLSNSSTVTRMLASHSKRRRHSFLPAARGWSVHSHAKRGRELNREFSSA